MSFLLYIYISCQLIFIYLYAELRLELCASHILGYHWAVTPALFSFSFSLLLIFFLLFLKPFCKALVIPASILSIFFVFVFTFVFYDHHFIKDKGLKGGLLSSGGMGQSQEENAVLTLRPEPSTQPQVASPIHRWGSDWWAGQHGVSGVPSTTKGCRRDFSYSPLRPSEGSKESGFADRKTGSEGRRVLQKVKAH